MSEQNSTTNCPTKVCSKCGAEYPATTEYFYAVGGKSRSLTGQCKTCIREYHQQLKINGASTDYIEMDAARKAGLKRCPVCKVAYPPTLEYFYHNAAMRDGLTNRCKKCHCKNNPKHGYAPSPHETRSCTRCGESYPLTDEFFHRDNNKRNGLCLICKSCANKQTSRWRTRNPERNKQSMANWYQNNKEHSREYKREYTQKNKEHVREIGREWKKNNPQRVHESRRLSKLRRRVSEHDSVTTLTTKEWLLCLEYWDYKCACCGRPLFGLFHKPSADHWVSVSKGGDTTSENIVPLCFGIDGCNNTKRDKDPTLWLVDRFGKRKAVKILSRINAYFDWVKSQR
jgi:hypothetical protein